MNQQYYLGPAKDLIHSMVSCSLLAIIRNVRYIVLAAKISKLHSPASCDATTHNWKPDQWPDDCAQAANKPGQNSQERGGKSQTTNGGDFLKDVQRSAPRNSVSGGSPALTVHVSEEFIFRMRQIP